FAADMLFGRAVPDTFSLPLHDALPISVAVVPSGSAPESLNPTTRGISIEMGWPSMAASASIPPTPQATTPRPLTMGVCESVPTRSEEHTSELQSRENLVCRLLLEKKNI